MFSGAAACALEPSVLSFAPRAPALPAASFARDRGRILRSRAFRRLAGKTQVVAAPGDPLVRTRLTHTLEVVAIARELGSGLQVRDDLVEAIALAHDVGHPAFGHAGERALASLGGSSFHHAAHGVRVVTVLEPGLDLSVEVVEGILKHSKGRGGPVFAGGPAQRSATVEARVVRAADLYAYACHDLDDAYRLGALRPADLPIEARRVLGATAESVRASLVDRTLAASGSGGDVRLDDPSAAALEVLRRDDFAFVHIEAPDECGHGGDVQKKLLAIELFDEKIVGPIWQELERRGEPYRLILCMDHRTPIATRGHTRDPVPMVKLDGPVGPVTAEAPYDETLHDGIAECRGHTWLRELLQQPR